MARKKYQTVTEQMYYVLLFLLEECCGADLVQQIKEFTNDQIIIGPGTLYSLLADFEKEGLIKETKIVGRKKSYIITDTGQDLLNKEYKRLQHQVELSKRFLGQHK